MPRSVPKRHLAQNRFTERVDSSMVFNSIYSLQVS